MKIQRGKSPKPKELNISPIGYERREVIQIEKITFEYFSVSVGTFTIVICLLNKNMCQMLA